MCHAAVKELSNVPAYVQVISLPLWGRTLCTIYILYSFW